MLIFLLLLVVHVPFAVNNYKALIAAKDFLVIFIPCISIILFVDTFDRLQLFMRCWIFLMIYTALKGISGIGLAGSSFLGDENDFALIMNMMLPFSICFFLYETKLKARLVYLIGSFLAIAGIIISSSRGGFVGLVAVFFVLWLASPRKLLSLVLISILVLTVYAATDQSYWEDMSTIEDVDEGTAKQRTDSWQAAWDMFKDHPLGVGPANFPILFPNYQPEGMRRNMWGRAAHSLWFTLLPELGIPGVLLYLSLFRANIRDLRYLKNLAPATENHRYAFFLSLAFMASLAGYFVSGSFLSVLYYPHYWYLTAMIVASRKVIGCSEP